ncbi:hypothetical protein BC629DRAFT_1532738 [Irpex lacteus]|nr:hypothetical protein BC629DRAFT_1532738 [Irpex lacteus]
MNFISLFFIGVAALFNVAWHHPQSLPTVYQLTLNSVQYAVCDISTPSAQYGTVCNFLDGLRLPAAPVVLTISAPDRYSWAELPPPPPVDANNSLVVTSSKPSLSQKVTSTAVVVRTPTASSKSLTPPDWLLDATDVVLTLLWLVLMCGLTILVYGAIWFKVEGVPENIIRGLTWLFCGPPVAIRRRVRRTDAKVEAPVYSPVTDSVDYDNTAGDVPETVPSLSSGPPAPDVPTPHPPVTEVSEQPVATSTTDAEPRKRVRCAARCQRIRKQKAQARAEQQEPAVEHLANAQTDPVEPRCSSRGGKQVRKRQRKQELKVARRAEADAVAGPSLAPIATPEFTADDFPPLGAGTSVQAKPIQLGMSFAAMVATGAPSPTAVIHKGAWTVKLNPAYGRPPADIKRRLVGSYVEEDWLRLDEEAWRKGRRKKKD